MLSAAGGLTIGVACQSAFAAAKATGLSPWACCRAPRPSRPTKSSAFLVIEPDNTVTIRLPHQEMGQGTTTALAMLVAEELTATGPR